VSQYAPEPNALHPGFEQTFLGLLGTLPPAFFNLLQPALYRPPK
jgi:hypothetical protein